MRFGYRGSIGAALAILAVLTLSPRLVAQQAKDGADAAELERDRTDSMGRSGICRASGTVMYQVYRFSFRSPARSRLQTTRRGLRWGLPAIRRS